ncbi:tetratricopeptide repeat protein [Alloacidobacterium sp.]|uniref:tetratricopeptide repeat protein n=1 Tax=Alloacidobacterium sp. TaxID=2951999 RepID=UPI002D34F168|nr:tetratricopeptide repeat protein [Alloacidobacterium sp.]HYK37770.1 tetratricopeptide repeat protein [Alloacidobacterium sp.]
MRKTLIPLTAVATLALLCPVPSAHAASKEMIQLQTQVQTLQDMLQRLQQTNDQRQAVMQHLIEQTADNVNRMSQSIDSMQQAMQTQSANTGKVDQLSGQMQSMNDSIDELKSRVSNLNKTLQDIQAQLQNVNTQQAGGGQPATPNGQPTPGGTDANAAPAQPQAPPVDQLYQGGLRDYNSAKYDVASGEFSDVLKYYPQDNLAGNAQFYLGEIAYRQGDYKTAIKNYDAVLEQFSGNPKVPAAQLRKGEAELATNQRDAGIRDLRNLIQRFPQTPEAAQARSRLNGMGVRITAPKPSPSAYHPE